GKDTGVGGAAHRSHLGVLRRVDAETV
ncbi:uncharacterized protein METZ01_LOCUS511197, partial [marine metagenome]